MRIERFIPITLYEQYPYRYPYPAGVYRIFIRIIMIYGANDIEQLRGRRFGLGIFPSTDGMAVKNHRHMFRVGFDPISGARYSVPVGP